MKGILVNPEKGAEVLEFEDQLEWYYNHLDCNTIDIATRQVQGKYFDFVCDDEGLWAELPVPSACNSAGKSMLVGKIFICNHDGFGNQSSLTDEECSMIMDHMATAMFNGGLIHVLADVDY